MRLNRKPSKPKPNPTPLPTPLRYLHPFLKSLAKLPLDQLNEDLDPTPLESALRKHLRGLDEQAAEAQTGGVGVPAHHFHLEEAARIAQTPIMPTYVRAFRPGGTFFLTLVTQRRELLLRTRLPLPTAHSHLVLRCP